MPTNSQSSPTAGLFGWAKARWLKARNLIRRHYNALIDVCFWIMLYVRGKALLQDFRILPEPLYPDNQWGDILYAIQLTLEYPANLVLVLLLVVGGLRDEFSERLWSKTATSFARFIVVMPFIWIGSLVLVYPWKNEEILANPIPSVLPALVTEFKDCVNLGYQQLEAMNFLIVEASMTIPVVLAGFYKWHRWRSGN